MNKSTGSDLSLLEEFGRFRRALNLHFTNALRPSGLGVKQASLLRNLSKRGKASLAELSRDTLTDPAAMTRLVGVLLKQGVVRQTEHPTDKRRWVLALTPRGEKTAAELEKTYQVLAQGVLKPLTEDERSRFSGILVKLTFALTAGKERGGPSGPGSKGENHESPDE